MRAFEMMFMTASDLAWMDTCLVKLPSWYSIRNAWRFHSLPALVVPVSGLRTFLSCPVICSCPEFCMIIWFKVSINKKPPQKVGDFFGGSWRGNHQCFVSSPTTMGQIYNSFLAKVW